MDTFPSPPPGSFIASLVHSPQKEGDGTKDVHISYLVTTETDFKTFQSTKFTVKRRFTDFYFLYKSLCRDYPACAVPPLPDKQRIEYVRGDRFSSDFTLRRCHSLNRFLQRITRHPDLQRSNLLLHFLESREWHLVMRGRHPSSNSITGTRSSGCPSPNDYPSGGVAGVFDSFTDSFLNAFSKIHRKDKRFLDVQEKMDKLNEDLSQMSKIVSRVSRREGSLENDFTELCSQFTKLMSLESGMDAELAHFSAGTERMSTEFRSLRSHTECDYLGSLKDMEAYVESVRSLLRAREQKQLDYEGLSDYLAKAVNERETLANQTIANLGPGNFLRSKIEDVRGVDHEQSRRNRLRKVELQIEQLTSEVESARHISEMFDEKLIREIGDFEAIKAAEFKETLGNLADAHVFFLKRTTSIWERIIANLESTVRSDP